MNDALFKRFNQYNERHTSLENLSNRNGCIRVASHLERIMRDTMKKLTSISLACLGLLTMVAASSSYAGNRPGALSFTVGGGYIYLNDKREMDNAGVGLVAVGYDLTEHWGVQGMLAGFRTDFDKEVNDDRRISGTLFNFDGVYHFMPEHMVEPYIAAGVGIMGLTPNQYEATNEGNINAALGAQIFFGNQFAFNIEARDEYTWVGSKNDVFLNAGISLLMDMC
jgi:OOP family OmpA-OmpF porin